jgi:prepilin-type N-terminal cleavage/methylation domain-containing protein
MNKKGFSFIEIILTVGILSLLTGIAVVSYLEYASTSQETAALQNLDTIKKAIEMTEATTRITCKGGPVSSLTNLAFSGNPMDPWGNKYHVNSDSCVVYSFGPDRIDDKGTEDDIALEYHSINGNVTTDPPLNLVADGKSGSIRLTWTHPGRNKSLETYRIEMRIDGKTEWTVLAKLPVQISEQPTWIDKSSHKSMIYYRVIAVYSEDKESRPSLPAGWVPVYE